MEQPDLLLMIEDYIEMILKSWAFTDQQRANVYAEIKAEVERLQGIEMHMVVGS